MSCTCEFVCFFIFFFSSRRRHTRSLCDWSSDVCSSDLYKKLEAAGRLTRPKHWQEFIPFAMAHTPLKMSIDEAHNEVRKGWANSYSPEEIGRASCRERCRAKCVSVD